MSKSLKDRIRDTSSLPTLPAAAIKVLQLAQNETTGMDELAEVISRDAGLSTKILRAVNSSFYGLEHQVGTVMQAVPLLGLDSVKSLVLGFTLVHEMRTRRPNGFNHLRYWRRSMYAAAAARTIARKVLAPRVEECFVATLLMDLGTLALDQMLGEDYSAIYEKAKIHSDLLILETHALGMTHAEVGGMLGAHWKLPDLLSVPMAYHHNVQEVGNPDLRALTEVVSLASRCGDIFTEEEPADSIATVRKISMERYRLGPVEVDALLLEIGQKTSELATLFEVRVNEAVNYDGIMAQAAQRLTELQLLELQTGQPQEPSNRRRAQRVRRDGRIPVIPCTRGVLSRPVLMRLRDLSASGIGLIHTHRMEPGMQFIVQLPGPDRLIKSLLYTVTRCETGGGLYSIGAELTCVLRPDKQNKPQAVPA